MTDLERYRKLLWGVVHNAHRMSVRGDQSGTVLFGLVSEICGCGSTMAKELCKEFGLDPYEHIHAYPEDSCICNLKQL